MPNKLCPKCGADIKAWFEMFGEKHHCPCDHERFNRQGGLPKCDLTDSICKRAAGGKCVEKV